MRAQCGPDTARHPAPAMGSPSRQSFSTFGAGLRLIQSEERDYRWEHNVITGRSSDKKADDLAQ